MSISKVRLPDNTEEDIKAKYLIQSTSSDAVSAEFSARTVTEDAIANIQKIYGNTVKWNQLNKADSATSTSGGITFTNNGNGSFTCSGTCTTLVTKSTTLSTSFPQLTSGHIYVLRGCPSGGNISTGYALRNSAGTIYDQGGGLRFTSSSTSSLGIYMAFRAGTYSNITFWPQLIDLTAIYGSGNEPTLSEFKAQYPASYYPYDPGSLTSNSATAILSRGFNQWDEEVQTASSAISSKNYIPAVGGATYYYKIPTGWLTVTEYDENKTQIGTAYSVNNATHSVASNCAYIKFITSSAYGSTYNHDICINISDPAKNGTYEPYNGHQIDLNIPTLTGKLNGAGSSVVIFPDGMKMAGTVYDEIVGNKAIKRVGSVDLGTLTWSMVSNASYPNRFQATISGIAVTGNNLIPGYTNKGLGGYGSAINEDKSFDQNNTTINIHDSSYSTAESFKTAMSGVMLYYELATPEEYILNNALQLQYPVVAGGTEMVLPTTGTAPMKMDVIYGNAADATSNLSSNFISVDSMKAFLNNLGTQMGGTWNMQYNNGKFEFTFSSS